MKQKERALILQNLHHLSEQDFDKVALDVFRYQYKYNVIYQSWVDSLNIDHKSVVTLEQIPFLPISAFKTHNVVSFDEEDVLAFSSSGTTGSVVSKHFVLDKELYLQNTMRIYQEYYKSIPETCFLALLPSYLERSGSSLIAMVERFIEESDYEQSGFYLYDHQDLYNTLIECKVKGIPTVLFGVSFALLDFIAEFQLDFPALTIIETGGMKGRKKEMSRKELHDLITDGFKVMHVHSEYGMTEMFSQAYSKENGIFWPGHPMKVVIREITDPFNKSALGKIGVINIIDLANLDSCSFLETQDLGKLYADGSFEVLGRLDAADIRGCNLMVSDL